MNISNFIGNIESNNNKTIVCDVDDVLLFTVPFWFNLIINSREKGHPYLNDKYLKLPKIYNYRNKEDFFYPMKRDTYDLANWLMKDNIHEIADKNIINNIKSCVLELINTDRFYLSPNLLVNNQLIRALNLALNKKSFGLEKLYIVTKSLDNNVDGKVKLLNKLFINNLDRTEIIIVGVNEKKSDFIKTIPEDIVMIFDDDLKNLNDVVENCDNCNDMNFLIPEYGFNSEVDSDIREKAIKKGIEIKYYSSSFTNIF